MINSHRNPHSVGALLQRAGGLQHGMDLSYFRLRRMLRERGLCIVAVRTIGFWVLRSRLRTASALASRGGRIAERLLRHRAWAAFAPDCIVVARKS